MNELNFKERTWLLSENSPKPKYFTTQTIRFKHSRNLLTNKIDSEIKLVNLLKSYGGKFSLHKCLFFDFESLGTLCSQPIDLPSNLFHVLEHVTFYSLKLQSEALVSILTYLKSILFILELNIVKMFLNSIREINSKNS